ncbi:EF-hand domain-containing protein [Nonomuraea endophytica]|uniref:EF-hand domain-containing protein n=1 Tax=Nonomuraea endophytica TaxID=714136 RepID=UPI0037C74D13
MGELRERKLRRLFDAIDTDGNGVITRHDLTLLSARYISELGLEPGQPQAERTTAVTERFWDQLIAPMDADGSGEVTPAELHAALEHLLLGDRAAYAATIRASNDVYFDLCDTDGSGQISEREFVRLMSTTCGIPAGDAARTFRSLIPAGQETMTRENWHQAMLAFFYDEDPDAPANNLFGQL